MASEHYDSSEPVNLGSSFELSIRDLVGEVVRATDFQGEIRWNSDKPNGQPRRKLDVTRAKERFGFEAQTTFAEGLRKTVDWYATTLVGEPI